jgi:hypothetical protein
VLKKEADVQISIVVMVFHVWYNFVLSELAILRLDAKEIRVWLLGTQMALGIDSAMRNI